MYVAVIPDLRHIVPSRWGRRLRSRTGSVRAPVCRTSHRPGTVVSWIIYCIRLLGGPATCGVHAKRNSLRSAMTFPQHWHAMIEHHETTPEQTYTWANWIKTKAPQQNPTPVEIRPTPKLGAPERKLADLDTTKFHIHWRPDADHHMQAGLGGGFRGCRRRRSLLWHLRWRYVQPWVSIAGKSSMVRSWADSQNYSSP